LILIFHILSLRPINIEQHQKNKLCGSNEEMMGMQSLTDVNAAQDDIAASLRIKHIPLRQLISALRGV